MRPDTDSREPAPESVTVTLPERILGRPWTVVELHTMAEVAEAIWAAVDDKGISGRITRGDADVLAAVAVAEAEPHLTREAKAAALREAAYALHDPTCLGCSGDDEIVVMADWLRERADITVAQRYNNPTDPGGEIRISVTGSEADQ